MIKRKYAAAFFVYGIILCLALCTTQEKVKSDEQNIKGMVKIYGSEPHTWAGVETMDEGKIYMVIPPEKAAELRSLQGLLLEFTVIIQDTAIPGTAGTANVLSWKIVQ